MAAHSSILSWRIPWTEEPDGLQSLGLQRVGHNSNFYFSLKAMRLGKICLEAAWIKKERCQRIKTCKAERLRRYRAIVKERFFKK